MGAALHKVTHHIERRIAKKGFVLGVFLDIEGAFDNVSFKAISEAIRATKVDPSTAQWIINMVTNRYINIRLNQTHQNQERMPPRRHLITILMELGFGRPSQLLSKGYSWIPPSLCRRPNVTS